jgi:ABC-type transporter Mla subunit MlaD
MEQSLFVGGVVCIAIFVGVAVPVLLQLRRTLRSAETFLETTGATLKQTLEEISSAAATLNHAAVGIEENTEGLARLFKGLGSVAGYLAKLRALFRGSEAPKAGADA